ADLGSAHGTFVNRLRIDEKTLEPGDQILIGEDALAFSEGAPPAIATAADAAFAEWQTGETSGPAASDPTAESANEMILAEHKVESGPMMRTIFGTRSGDGSAAPAARTDAEVSGHLV